MMERDTYHVWRWRLVAVWIVAFSLLVAYVLHSESAQVDKANKARVALCAQRRNLQLQTDASVRYLQQIHSGVRKPIPGISEADILSTITRSRKAIQAYNALDCPPEL